ncbi:arsenic resistance protein [Pseudomonas halotolerans]|uniref:arsenic resistance protein n=1 Tax=Pseudomonas halotolerans TaxID=3143552 RepID=UPI0031DE7375
MGTTQPIGFFERYLSVWVALCIAAGIGLGSLFPQLFQTLAGYEYGSVNFIVAGLIWLMVYPMMVSMGLLARPMLIAQASGPVAAALILEKFGSTPLLAVMCVLVAGSFITSLALPAK